MNGEPGCSSPTTRSASPCCSPPRTGRLRLPVGDTRTLKLAYAISVHKAQGSQMPIAVVPLFRGHHLMLTRNLLYTAVTRSERVTVLISDPGGCRARARRRRDAHAPPHPAGGAGR